MKKTVFKVLFASFVVFALASCVHNQTSNNESSSIDDRSPSINDSSSSTDNNSSSANDNSSSINSNSSSFDNSSSSSNDSSSSSAPQAIYYHVIFLNDDETKLYEIDVLEGNEAVYVGETPTKKEDEEFTYTFKGWDKDLSSIITDVTTKAEYTATPIINWGPIIWL